MSTSSANTLKRNEELLSQVFKLYSSRDYDCVIAAPLTVPYLVRDTVVFPLQKVPAKIEETLTIAGRSKHSDFLGEVAHLAGHLRYRDMQQEIVSLEEPVRSLAWHLEDARTMKDHLTRREHDTLLLKARFQAFLSTFSRLESPTQFDYLLMWSTICSRADIALITPEEQASLRKKMSPHLSPQVLEDAETLVKEMMKMEAGDGEFGRRCLQLTQLLPEQVLSPELQRQCVMGVQEEIDGGGSGQGDDSDDREGNDSSEAEASEEGLDSETDPNSEPESPEQEIENEEQSPSSETSDEQESTKDTKQDVDEEDFTEDDLGDALDVPDDKSDPDLDIPEYKATQQKEKEELAVMDNAALRNMKRFGLDKKGVKLSSRPPTQSDVQLASKMALMFKKARWRAPTKIVKRSAIPPGKLVPRAAVLSAAQRSMGLPVTAEPFRQTFKKREEGPPIILGLMCDVSGSMTASADPMAQFAWACSRAVPKAGGEFAAVTFGQTVRTLVPLNSRLNAVPKFTTKDGYEAGHEAMLTLAGGLGFFRKKEGVKVLLISSDAYWQPNQVRSSMQVLNALQKMGVIIIWLPFDKDLDDRSRKMMGMDFAPAPMKYGRVVRFSKMDDAPKELGKLLEEEARKA